ncbi:DUF4302 domain-containing protein [Pedobacter endophyticus]|uniref:DUF4302 domain-containing protein n=1 Tax=Pedobacter endophyticus TaxID=2789740 RepID=A0A7U3Q4N0_9SPHI|nr:DUF4302 domain-containing protein [Pedobacter endophyticus]QPH38518.1 DUF4302 domain-containing protein [Pedobacter endophyticus]
MKKHLLYLFFFALALNACKKDDSDPIIGDVDERLTGTLADYQAQLVGAEFGWKAYLLTNNKTPATFLFNFTNKNRVTMEANYEPGANESSYRLKALQKPALLFDSYSTLHLLADPNPNVYGGATAAGYSSDFEFAFLSSSADTIKLEGTFNKSKLLLIRSKSKEESEAVFTSVEDVSDVVSKVKTYFKRTIIGGIECELNLNGNAQTLSLSYLDGGTLKTVKSSYYVDQTTIQLYEPLVIGKTSISKLERLSFDSATGILNTKAGGEIIQIKEAIKPMQYDITAAKKWFNNPPNGYYWFTDGFTVDGIDDAYGVKTIPGYNYLIFYSAYRPQYSRLGFIVNGGYAAYGPAPIAIFPDDGTIKFNNAGFFGTAPAEIRPIVTNTQNNLFLTAGFYAIQTDVKGGAFDLVSVSDARTWISFRR